MCMCSVHKYMCHAHIVCVYVFACVCEQYIPNKGQVGLKSFIILSDVGI